MLTLLNTQLGCQWLSGQLHAARPSGLDASVHAAKMVWTVASCDQDYAHDITAWHAAAFNLVVEAFLREAAATGGKC